MFDRILNVTLSDELLTTVVTQGNLDIPLLPKSLDSVEILDRTHVLISFNENSSTGQISLKTCDLQSRSCPQLVFIDILLLFAHDHLTKIYDPFHLFVLLCTTIRPKIRVHTDIFLYLYTTIRPKVRVPINLFNLFVHNHSIKNQGPH